MVAYSFRPQFVEAIKRGLEPGPLAAGMKRQTIRAYGNKRHAIPGDEIQLYQGQRTKQCRLIGNARCVERREVAMIFRSGDSVDEVRFDFGGVLTTLDEINAFAIRDGFANWKEMRAFWLRERGPLEWWYGLLIEWEPL